MKTAYTYTVLRYVHDITTGEFANVGVVIYAPRQRFVGARFRSTYARLTRMFPGVDGLSLRSILGRIETSFDRVARTIADELPLEKLPESVGQLAAAILPADDSSLQWSQVSSGVTDDPSAMLERLWERYVLRYESKSQKHRRSDDEIWRSFKKAFDERRVTEHLVPKTIAAENDEKEFLHTWKNGVWHCVEPVSFDLSSYDSMKEKAIKWLGQIASLRIGTKDDFKVYFLVGGPRNSGGTPRKNFERAIKILEKAENAHVIKEEEAYEFSNRVAVQIEKHNRES